MTIKLKKTYSIICIAFLLYSIVGIVNTVSVSAASIGIATKKTFVMYPTEVFIQKLLNTNGNVIKATKVKWRSAKPSVAKINKKGRIVALKCGTANMSAKYNGKTYKFTVKVKNPLKGKRPKRFNVYDHYEYLGYLSLYWDGIHYVNSKWQIYISKNNSPYKLYKTIKHTYFDYKDIKDGVKYRFKVREILGKYKSKFTTVKTFYHKKNPKALAQDLHDYIVSHGTYMDYDYIPGSYCITSQSIRYDNKGYECRDTYLISTNPGGSDLYFGLVTVVIDPSLPANHYTKEYTYLFYNSNTTNGNVRYIQKYWWDLMGIREWYEYVEGCVMNYALYNGLSTGLSSFTIGTDDVPNSRSSKDIVGKTTLMMRGVNDMLENKIGNSLYDYGFTSMS